MSIEIVSSIPKVVEGIVADFSTHRKAIAALETALGGMFEMTQTLCPVDTGSLRNSGFLESDYDQWLFIWSGSIEYGGDSPGFPNDPVDYAGIVQDRYAPDDWINASADAWENAFDDAVGLAFT